LRDFAGRLYEAGIREAIIQIPAQFERAQIERIAAAAVEMQQSGQSSLAKA
jgi:hypothetical protein